VTFTHSKSIAEDVRVHAVVNFRLRATALLVPRILMACGLDDASPTLAMDASPNFAETCRCSLDILRDLCLFTCQVMLYGLAVGIFVLFGVF